MQKQISFSRIGSIFAVLAKVSARQRHAFLVLQLVTEATDAKGRADPFVTNVPNDPMLLRYWLCNLLLPISERDGCRAALRVRVIESIRDRLTREASQEDILTEGAVEDQVLAEGRANISRAILDLVKAGFLSRR